MISGVVRIPYCRESAELRVGNDIPLGTDTFVVDNGKIVSQTFAMYAVPAQ